MSEQIGQFNHYICEKCGATTVALHEHAGTTPFMLRCRATRGCDGWAQSRMYRCSQEATQRPHVIWFRPKTTSELRTVLKGEPRRFRDAIREHFRRGGCLLKVGPGDMQGQVH
jgi:hypothetical protein